MVEVQNTEIVNNLAKEIKESNPNVVPKSIVNSVQPVIIVNVDHKENSVVQSATRETTGTTTIFTTPADKDFFIIAASIDYTADVVADSILYSLDVVPFGDVSKPLIQLRKNTITLQNDNDSIHFPVAIKLARSSIISMTQAFTVGASSMDGHVFGFTVDTLDK